MNTQKLTIAITGGSGFVGRAITRLLQPNHTIIWLSSSTPTLSDEFANVTVKTVNYNDTDSVSAAMTGCDIVIHLIGILHATRYASFDDIHHQLPRRIVQACADAGVPHYLHMSALGADAEGPSQYLTSKYLGEQAAFEIAQQRGVSMLSFRPSIIFGKEDNFFNQFARLLKFTPVFPVPCPTSQFQPVSVNDVAKAFAWGLSNTLDSPHNGSTYELAGTERITMMGVLQRVCEFYGWKRLLIPLPNSVSKLQAKAMNYIPNAPMTMDNYLSLQKPNISERWDWDTMKIEPEDITLTNLWDKEP